MYKIAGKHLQWLAKSICYSKTSRSEKDTTPIRYSTKAVKKIGGKLVLITS
jgi:hypothetical protein